MSQPLAGNQLEVSTEETAKALADDAAQVIDVREDYEREAGHVAGTRHIALGQIAANAESVDPERPVIFMCRVGSRSLMAAQAFRQAGFDAYSVPAGCCSGPTRAARSRPRAARSRTTSCAGARMPPPRDGYRLDTTPGGKERYVHRHRSAAADHHPDHHLHLASATRTKTHEGPPERAFLLPTPAPEGR
jgi:rhodanese-related sulfurtransferase